MYYNSAVAHHIESHYFLFFLFYNFEIVKIYENYINSYVMSEVCQRHACENKRSYLFDCWDDEGDRKGASARLRELWFRQPGVTSSECPKERSSSLRT